VVWGSLGAAVATAVALYLPLTLLAPISTVAATAVAYTDPAPAPATIAWPANGASAVAAVGYPEVAATNGSTAALPIASISKIITSLVVLEAKPLALEAPGPTITVSAADAALVGTYQSVGGKTVPMAAGAALSERDLMTVALVASANNYAAVLADWAFGSQAAFATAAKAWLLAHGFGQTTIVEPTGMSPANVSTATELVAIGQLALANHVVARIVSTPSFTLPGVGILTNSNALLGHDGVEGIKTGTLNEAGACLLFAAHYSIGGTTITVVGAVLGALDHKTLNADVRAMLASVKAGFHEVRLASKGEPFASYATPWKQKARAIATKAASIVVWSNPRVSSEIAARNLALPSKGAAAGRVTFTVGDQKIRVPLALDRGFQDPGVWWRLTNPGTLMTASR
jgi:D-alanyl-D-alanine carboxypeptidase (penicillin-binding protein 5/6)